MNLTRQLMATTDDLGASIQQMAVQHGLESRSRRDELHQIQNDYYDAGTLMGALESISANGLVNNGTNMLTFRELERLGVELDGKGLESIDDPNAIHQAGLEGLGHVVNRLKDRLNNWSDRNKLDHENSTGKVADTGVRLVKELRAIKVKLQALDVNASADVKMDSLRDMLTAGDESFPDNPVAWLSAVVPAVINQRVDFERRVDAMAGKLQSALSDLDLTSDAAFKKSWLAKSTQFEPLFLKKMPPNVEFAPARHNVIHDNKAAESYRQYVAGNVDDRDLLRVPIYGFGSYTAKKATGSKSAKIAVKDMLKLVDQMIETLIKHTPVTVIRQTNKIADRAEDLLIMTYLIEIQRGVKNPKHINGTTHNLRPGSLQMLAGPMNWYTSDGMYQLIYPMLTGANAALQLARRLVTAVKQ